MASRKSLSLLSSRNGSAFTAYLSHTVPGSSTFSITRVGGYATSSKSAASKLAKDAHIPAAPKSKGISIGNNRDAAAPKSLSSPTRANPIPPLIPKRPKPIRSVAALQNRKLEESAGEYFKPQGRKDEKMPGDGLPVKDASAKATEATSSGKRLDVQQASRKEAVNLADLDQQEIAEKLDNYQRQIRENPRLDPWGQQIETLDVQIPYSVSLRHYRHYPSFRAWRKQWSENISNHLKNAGGLWMLAAHNQIPGKDFGQTSFFKKLFLWPRFMWSARSLKSNSWLSPLRSIALETYQNVNTALAKADEKTLKKLTTFKYQNELLKLLKKRNPKHTYIWRYHGEVTPTRVVSFRVQEGIYTLDDPKIGSRLMVHALVKFDTMQSIEIYDEQGNALHKPAPGAVKDKGFIAAEQTRVQEYLLLEKRMWYVMPWLIREQFFELAGKTPVDQYKGGKLTTK